MKFRFWVKEGSDTASNRRRFFTVISIAIIVMILGQKVFSPRNEAEGWITVALGVIATSWSLLFFLLVVLAIPFLTSQSFWPNAIRLLRDGFVSALLAMVSFSLWYRIFGITDGDPTTAENTWDHVYFSAVTFSTLGFGDYRPVGWSKAFAACQAVFGNLHLGFIVGTAFFAAQKPFEKSKEGNCDQNGRSKQAK